MTSRKKEVFCCQLSVVSRMHGGFLICTDSLTQQPARYGRQILSQTGYLHTGENWIRGMEEKIHHRGTEITEKRTSVCAGIDHGHGF